MEQFHLFQDENSHHTFAGAPLQSTVSQRQASIDARGPLKAPVSARKALGNITNAGTIDGQASLKSQVGALGSRNGGRLGKNNGEVFVERPKTRQPLRSIQKQEKATSHVADNKHERLRDLMEGGVERPAGRLWEEEEMVLELQREEQLSKRMSGLVKGHRNAILHQIDLLMDSSDHVDMEKVMAEELDRDAYDVEPEKVEQRCLESPQHRLRVYCSSDDDDCLVLP